jgi:hypothetical protein
MSGQIILRFLRVGLIDVGGDDAKLEKLQETAADLAAALKKTPSKAIPFALIAFDPEAPDEDPVIKEAIDALQKRWATYVNTFSGTPILVLRAVLLDALVQAASENDKIGVAFVASARNVLPFMEVGNEEAIWPDVIQEIEQHVDAQAEAEWATPETINVPAMTFQPPAAIEVSRPQVSIDEAGLAKKFEAAAGPNSPNGATDGNPYWPNNNQHWLGEFGSRMATAVAEALSAVAKGSEIKPIDLAGPLKGLAQAVSVHVDETLKAVSGATAGLQRRTNLIWWKETLYSPSARVSYRAMPASIAAALMALDLHRQVPTFSPASVAAFLHETVLSLPFLEVDESRPILDLLMETSRSDQLAPLRQAVAELIPEPAGRGPILGLIGHGAGRSPLDGGAFRRLVGVPPSTALTVPQWATWIFRELQAARATQEGNALKKRGRKT